ncbi:M48 family metalloprotease [Epibacterium sp. SM1979]|uniref:M48 family metalloprotease n=1 Tax=Tritonibacter litoralis TaxID=2662264 RepID=A0A843YB71_9RHOB|nr:M48 family metallopeptidase [Tritonibacter litoralis]MQQ08226.1 M48 family metalloprotease [Tritonibacter litoralis]
MSAHDPSISGWAFRPGSSERISARLDVSADWIFLTDPDDGLLLTKSAPLDVRLDQAAGAGPRNVYFADGWMFQTEDHQISILMQEPLPSRLLRHFEIFRLRLAAFIFLSLLSAFAAWSLAVPALVTVAVWLTPHAALSQIDKASIKSLDLTVFEESDLSADKQKDQKRVLKQLMLSVDANRPFTLIFREMPGMGANAAALPGGTIIVSDELVTRYGDDPTVIAGVLAHEMGHVVEQHGLKQLYRALTVYALITLVAGDVGPILENVLLEGQTLASLSYSRKHELSADRFAVDLLYKSGFSPEGLQRLFKDVEETDGENSWFATHPSSAERLKQIKEMADHRK